MPTCGEKRRNSAGKLARSLASRSTFPRLSGSRTTVTAHSSNEARMGSRREQASTSSTCAIRRVGVSSASGWTVRIAVRAHSLSNPNPN